MKKDTSHKLVSFQVISHSAHQAELGRYQGNFILDAKYPFNGAHGLLTYDLPDKS